MVSEAVMMMDDDTRGEGIVVTEVGIMMVVFRCLW